MSRIAVIITALFTLLIAPAYAQYDERITDYRSDIAVARNGVLTVTETISIIAADDRIVHGIYRDFPATYTDTYGRVVRVRFDVLQVTRDGHDEPFEVEDIDSGRRVKIGNKDVEVSTGPHTYTITYVTDRQIGFYKDYDELYWNVTGNFWIFQIDHAIATVHLPANAQILQRAFYTGAAGSRDKNARVVSQTNSTISIETTEPLGPDQGLTIAVGFSKGAVLPPTPAELRADFIRDNAGNVVAVLGVAILFIYFLVTWYEFGRDPRRGTIVPLFTPPQDFSPAAVRYVWKMHYDRKSFSASLIDMAVKGYLKIMQRDNTYALTRTNRDPFDATLSGGERAIATKLFGDEDTIELKQDNHSAISGAISALRTSLKNEYEKRYFVTNLHWFIGGVAILGLSALGAAMLGDNAGGSSFLLIWLSGWSVGTFFLLHRMADSWSNAISGPGSKILNIFSALISSVFAVPFLGALIFALFMFGQSVSIISSAALIAGGLIAYVFYHLLKAPTAAGAKILDQIEGFRLFLNTAEKDRLEVLNPPQVTPAVFEKFLPYAIALDCENQWSKQFEAEAAAAGMTPNQQGGYYSPIWYSGGNFNNFGAATFAGSLGASLAESAASAAVAPGSSSGSGGGGFSGGGGGGGGGGGW